MKIEVVDKLFSDLAKKLETSPENVIKVFLDHAKNLPYSILSNANQKNNSLDTALRNLMDNAEPAYLMGEIIQKIVGDRDYTVEDSGYDFEEGTFWFEIDFSQDGKGILETAHLQFGKNSVILGTFSIKNLVEEDQEDFTDSIDEIISNNTQEEHYSSEIDWLDENSATVTISIYTENILDLPKVSVLEKIAHETMDFFSPAKQKNRK
ncbi:MAG: hypothetical protein COW26_02920 [Nitrosopumilales archaeon CG15_BIG_FIL_POST_REV_8_21_14_020_33_23]|nr:MAG: hypothetical protein COV65_06790 [Nitrosopumilales archaeon CG11_big_fil_rev_8_21_14_0_20_33_24]PIW35721.1 MAG: hypothetical protein COW26_02920 [Nitrosopumilales archaeon CG15_BIG_FIL_POST_REV_8_21_14_020_33_23]PIY89462.1 MAG: hypothetical protein COY74_05845 [Nitrosopumilales archaeon CG_4_10_14_0_8_um_filter_34_8]PJB99170.1 MAG: hypothetical protein CO079_00235 [Nitrosopumilales archaeon CG_4_9_14_0_8_um_filter_34_10]